MEPVTFLLLLLLVAVVWIALSPDKLAETLRARFKGTKARMADALDDAVDRVEAAIADAELQLQKANGALVTIKSQRKLVENAMSDAKAQSTKWQTAAENAASVSKKDLVLEALSRKAATDAEVASLTPQFNLLLSKEQEVQNAVNALTKRKADLAKQKVEIKVRAKTATTVLDVNTLLVGVDLTGKNRDVEKAFNIVREVEAKSGAMSEIAGAVVQKQNTDAELEALSHQSSNVEADADALMAKFAKK